MDERVQELKDYGMEKAVRRSKNYRSGFEHKSDWDDYYDKGNEECRVFYRQMDKFILANVNRPYKNVYADFCKKWPARIGKYTDTRWAFRSECGVDDINYRNACDFIVDERGILRKNKDSWRFTKKEKKRITIGYKDDEKTYEVFNKALLKYPKIIDFFTEILGRKNIADIMECNRVSKKVLQVLDKNEYRIHEFLRNKRGYIKNGSWVTKSISEKTPIEVIEGTPEYTQTIYEMKQANRRTYKKEMIERKSKIATLLHDLTQAAKRAEEEKNIIDRDRLGFTEESFIGEPYHGQKRKIK